MRKFILSGIMIAVSFTAMAQSLEKMQWFNEPEQWEIQDTVRPVGADAADRPRKLYKGRH